jgi:hypothetical protein
MTLYDLLPPVIPLCILALFMLLGRQKPSKVLRIFRYCLLGYLIFTGLLWLTLTGPQLLSRVVWVLILLALSRVVRAFRQEADQKAEMATTTMAHPDNDDSQRVEE